MSNLYGSARDTASFPDSKKSNTYYMIGNRIVKVHTMATDIKEDFVFLMSDPEAAVYGCHYNGQRWTLDRKLYIAEYNEHVSTPSDPAKPNVFGFNSMLTVEDDHPVAKLLTMYELVGAV
jgi:hypothetical protein